MSVWHGSNGIWWRQWMHHVPYHSIPRPFLIFLFLFSTTPRYIVAWLGHQDRLCFMNNGALICGGGAICQYEGFGCMLWAFTRWEAANAEHSCAPLHRYIHEVSSWMPFDIRRISISRAITLVMSVPSLPCLIIRELGLLSWSVHKGSQGWCSCSLTSPVVFLTTSWLPVHGHFFFNPPLH